MSSCRLLKTKSLETSCETCRHVGFRKRNRLGHLAKVVVMSASENEIAWDILQKLSSCRLQKRNRLRHPAKVVVMSDSRKPKSLETSCESCHHAGVRKRNRLRHPANVVVMSASENEIAWDILQKLSSCRLPKTKSLGTSCERCRHVGDRKRNRLRHPAKVVIM